MGGSRSDGMFHHACTIKTDRSMLLTSCVRGILYLRHPTILVGPPSDF
jgi:hypothetical protein